MVQWVVCVPVWGEPYTETFIRVGLPALKAAAAKAPEVAVTIALYSDNPSRITAATDLNVSPRPLPSVEGPFNILSECHRDVLRTAGMGERVCLLTADLVVSSNMITSAEDAFVNSSKMIVAVGSIRGLLDFDNLPTNFDSRTLLEWAWTHPHPMTTESIYPQGTNQDASRMFFVKGDTVVTRQLLPHPLVLVNDGRNPPFTPTIDSNLLASYHDFEVYVPTEPSEMGLVELSVLDKAFHRVNSMRDRVTSNQLVCVNPMQRFLFEHRIGIKGRVEDCGDDAVYRLVESYSHTRYPLYTQGRPDR